MKLSFVRAAFDFKRRSDQYKIKKNKKIPKT